MVATFVRAIEDTGADCVLGGFTKRDGEGNSQFEFKLEDAVWEGDELAMKFIPRVLSWKRPQRSRPFRCRHVRPCSQRRT